MIGLSARSETGSVFNRDILSNRHQLLLYGLALLFTLLPTELGFLQSLGYLQSRQSRFGLTNLDGNQWLICIGLALVLLLVDEAIKIFLRRGRSHEEGTPAVPAQAPA